jgi:hypothetical protein
LIILIESIGCIFIIKGMMLTVIKVAPLAHATKEDWSLNPAVIRKPDLSNVPAAETVLQTYKQKQL